MRNEPVTPRSRAISLISVLLFLLMATPAAAGWVQKAKMNTPRARYAFALQDGRFYALFGNNGATLLKSVEVYDPAADQWTQSVPDPLQSGVQDVSAAPWNGKIYLFGGNFTSPLDVQPFFRSYDTAAGTLTDETPRNLAVASPNAVAYTETAPASGLGPLKVFGGVLASGLITSQVSAYDPGARVWTQGASIPAAMLAASPGAGVYTPFNRVYFFGGDTGQGASTLVTAYDYFSKTYITEGLGSLNVSRRFPAFGSMPFANGRFYLAGGNQGITGFGSQVVEVYDPVLRAAWRLAEELPEGLSAMGSFCMAGADGAYTLCVAGGLVADDQSRSDRLWALCVDNGRGQLPSQLPPDDTDLNGNGVWDMNEPDVIKDAVTVAGGNIVGVDISGDPDILSILSVQAIPADFAGSPPRAFGQGALTFSLAVTPGEDVFVDVYFAEDTPAGAIWYKYTAAGGWQSYADNTQTASVRHYVLHLQDGGFGDADGTANGVIVDPGGPTTAIPPTPTPETKIVVPQGNGCFVESLTR